MVGSAGGSSPSAVVVVGSVNVDYVFQVLRRPAAGETVTEAVLAVLAGGKGANQAAAAALCGASVSLLGRVGDDALGQARRVELTSLGVDTSLVGVTPGAMTGVAFITVTPDGENAIVVAPGANITLSPVDADNAQDAIGGASVLVAQLEVPVAVVARAAEIAPRDTPLVLNAAPVRDLPASLLKRVDVLVVNEHEAGQIVGQSVIETRDAMEATSKLLALGPTAVVITLGPEGAVLAEGETRQHVPAPPAKVVDTTGAGDAFVGALAAKLAASATLAEAMRYAVGVGTATVGYSGAEPHIPAANSDPFGN